MSLPGSDKGAVGFAVVGCGHAGMRHARLIEAEPGARLVALADVRAPDTTGADGLGVPCFDSLNGLLISPQAADVGVLVVATPNGWHADQTCIGLRAGKHVIVEKPMALNNADAARILRTSAESGRNVYPVLQIRFSPGASWLKQIVAGGGLGDIYLVQVQCFWNRDSRYYAPGSWHGRRDLDGGALFTQFSHFVDLIYWLFGDIGNIRSRFQKCRDLSTLEFEDTGVIQFDFASGGMGSLSFSTAAWERNLESSVTIIGQFGSVKVEGQYLERIAYCHLAGASPGARPPEGPDSNHVQFLRAVIADLRGAVHPPVAGATDGAAVTGIIERMYQAT